MLVSKRKMNVIWLNKWALIREKREEMERICNNIRMIKQRKYLLAKNIKACHLIKEVYEIFAAKRAAVLKEIRINFAVFRLSNRLKGFLRRKGPDRLTRAKRLIKDVCTLQGNNFFTLKTEEAKREITKFLRL